MTVHGYICECNAKSCRRRLYMKAPEYEVLAKIGMVLSAECARREGRTIVTRYNGYRIVVAQNRGKALV